MIESHSFQTWEAFEEIRRAQIDELARLRQRL
jgi:hypothetical protein